MSCKRITKKDVYQFLKQNKHAVISTISIDNTPESSLIYYGVDRDLNFYIVIGDKSRKYPNMLRNSKVALVISDEYILKTVQVEGNAEELKKVKKNSKAITTLTKALSRNIWQTIAHIWEPIPPVIKMHSGIISIFKITPTWLRCADFSGPDGRSDEDYFKVLIP